MLQIIYLFSSSLLSSVCLLPNLKKAQHAGGKEKQDQLYLAWWNKNQKGFDYMAASKIDTGSPLKATAFLTHCSKQKPSSDRGSRCLPRRWGESKRAGLQEESVKLGIRADANAADKEFKCQDIIWHLKLRHSSLWLRSRKETLHDRSKELHTQNKSQQVLIRLQSTSLITSKHNHFLYSRQMKRYGFKFCILHHLQMLCLTSDSTRWSSCLSPEHQTVQTVQRRWCRGADSLDPHSCFCFLTLRGIPHSCSLFFVFALHPFYTKNNASIPKADQRNTFPQVMKQLSYLSAIDLGPCLLLEGSIEPRAQVPLTWASGCRIVAESQATSG